MRDVGVAYIDLFGALFALPSTFSHTLLFLPFPSHLPGHRTMRDVGVAYIDLFAALFAIYQEGRREGKPRLQLHALDAMRDLTSRW